MRHLSIIIPIFNEEQAVSQSLPPIFNLPIKKEIILVNDGSTDQTGQILKNFQKQFNFILLEKTTNQGKGQSIIDGSQKATGKWLVICDADLEYDPNDIVKMYKIALKSNQLVAIWGSRFLQRRFLWSSHYWANRFLTFITNLLFNSQLTDMETCYKMMPTKIFNSLKLSAKGFEIEPQITARILKKNIPIQEIPIHYNPRSYDQGKKIRFKDGLIALKTLFKEKLSNNFDKTPNNI